MMRFSVLTHTSVEQPLYTDRTPLSRTLREIRESELLEVVAPLDLDTSSWERVLANSKGYFSQSVSGLKGAHGRSSTRAWHSP